MIPLPPKLWLALGGVAMLLGSHGFVYVKGRGDGAAHVEARYGRAIGKAQKAMRKAQTRLDGIGAAGAAAAADQQQETRSIYHETLRVIERPIYRTVCVDGDGVGLLDRAAVNANRTPHFVQPAD